MTPKKQMDMSWTRTRDQIQKIWDGLEDDDLKKVRGNLGQTIDLIHKTTGEERDVIMRKMRAVI